MMSTSGVMNYGAESWEDGVFGAWCSASVGEGLKYAYVDGIDTSAINVEEIAKRLGGIYLQQSSRSISIVSDAAYIRIHEDSAAMWYEPGSETADKIAEELEATPKLTGCFVRWFRQTQHGIQSTNMPLHGNAPKSDFYPWLGQSLESFWDEYINSDASVLLLIGAPGTGKTSFLRGMLYHTKMEAWITYDESVQRDESLYTAFATVGESYATPEVAANIATTSAIGQALQRAAGRRAARIRRAGSGPLDSARALILEDSDEMLSSRQDGNRLMSRILNLADGLIQLPRRKVIFTTNLPNLSSVDEALLRPGRCFAVLNFRKLDRDEAVAAAASVGVDRSHLPPGAYTLAQVLGDQKQGVPAVRKIGF